MVRPSSPGNPAPRRSRPWSSHSRSEAPPQHAGCTAAPPAHHRDGPTGRGQRSRPRDDRQRRYVRLVAGQRHGTRSRPPGSGSRPGCPTANDATHRPLRRGRCHWPARSNAPANTHDEPEPHAPMHRTPRSRAPGPHRCPVRRCRLQAPSHKYTTHETPGLVQKPSSGTRERRAEQRECGTRDRARNRQDDRYDLVDGRPPSVIAILSASDSENAPLTCLIDDGVCVAVVP